MIALATPPAKPVAISHCYNVSASCIEGRAAVTENTHDTPAAAASLKAAQLHALLCLSAESMETAAADLRSNLLSLATDLAREVRALCELAAEVV
ncbi:hypothetical protein [Cupriavidus basilensis]